MYEPASFPDLGMVPRMLSRNDEGLERKGEVRRKGSSGSPGGAGGKGEQGLAAMEHQSLHHQDAAVEEASVEAKGTNCCGSPKLR